VSTEHAWWITRYTPMANAQPKLNDLINSAVDEKNKIIICNTFVKYLFETNECYKCKIIYFIV